MKKNSYLSTLFGGTLCLFICTLQCSKKEIIKNIIEKNALKTVAKHTKTHYITSTKLEFYSTIQLPGDDQFLGESSFYYQEYNNIPSAFLDFMEVKEDYHNCGLGEQLFYKTMYYIHKKYPEVEEVTWYISPCCCPEDMTQEEALQKLFKFYRRVGAIVDEKYEKGSINLKEAGYFDED